MTSPKVCFIVGSEWVGIFNTPFELRVSVIFGRLWFGDHHLLNLL